MKRPESVCAYHLRRTEAWQQTPPISGSTGSTESHQNCSTHAATEDGKTKCSCLKIVRIDHSEQKSLFVMILISANMATCAIDSPQSLRRRVICCSSEACRFIIPLSRGPRGKRSLPPADSTNLLRLPTKVGKHRTGRGFGFAGLQVWGVSDGRPPKMVETEKI